ncbi:MAG TPA: GntR family transcriptional regulator, partial [Micromonosporaceae bacterium]
TFVAEPRIAYRLEELHSLADDLRAQGLTVDTTVVSRGMRRTTQLPSERALRLERIRRLAGRPAIHQVSWVAEPYGSRLLDVDFAYTSLYSALAELDVVVHRASERLRPALLAKPVAEMLGETTGTAVFVSERTTYGLDEAPVVFDRATILGDVMEIRTERAATKVSLRWGRATA